jgi:hypothetical protein
VTSYPPPPPPGQGPGYAPDHPRATVALVLGILSLVLCQILGPVAWVIGGGAVREIDASGGTLGGRGSANAGRILGIIATVLLVLGIVAVVLLLVLGVSLNSTYNGSAPAGPLNG